MSKTKAFENLEYSHIKHFTKILCFAKERYNFYSNEIIEDTFDFIDKCIHFVYDDQKGPLAIKKFIFHKSKIFLFGNASQHRKKNVC